MLKITAAAAAVVLLSTKCGVVCGDHHHGIVYEDFNEGGMTALPFNHTSLLPYTTNPRPRFLLFGDSITEMAIDPKTHGFDNILAKAYCRKVDVINRGLSGYTTRTGLGVLPYILDEWRAHAPNLVTVFFGANDAVLPNDPKYKRIHVPLQEYRSNLKTMVAHLQAAFPAVQILLVAPPPVDDAARRQRGAHRLNRVTETYARACVQIAKELHLPSIDTWTLFQQQPQWQRMFLDGLHFNTTGHEFMYRLLQRRIDESLPQFARENIPKQYHY